MGFRIASVGKGDLMLVKFAKWRKAKARKLSSWIHRHSLLCFVVIVAAIPLILTGAYNIHIVDHRALAPESVLSYFGVALGIGFSFYQLLLQRERDARESRNKRRPFVSLRATKTGSAFCLELADLGSKRYADIYLFDEFVSSALAPNQPLKVLVESNGEEIEATKNDVIKASSLSGWDNDTDEAGFPREIVFYLHDALNTQWVATFLRSRNGSDVTYFANVEEGNW